MSTLYVDRGKGSDRVHNEEHTRLQEGFDKLDGRERLYLAPLRPTNPGAPFLGAAAVESVINGFESVRYATGIIQNATCQIQVYRGWAAGSETSLEVSWVNEIAPAGTMAVVFQYTPILARAGSVIGILPQIDRIYTVPTAALTLFRDRIPIDGLVPREDDILGVVITRRRDNAADTYQGLATRRIHIIKTVFTLRGADGEDV